MTFHDTAARRVSAAFFALALAGAGAAFYAGFPPLFIASAFVPAAVNTGISLRFSGGGSEAAPFAVPERAVFAAIIFALIVAPAAGIYAGADAAAALLLICAAVSPAGALPRAAARCVTRARAAGTAPEGAGAFFAAGGVNAFICGAPAPAAHILPYYISRARKEKIRLYADHAAGYDAFSAAALPLAEAEKEPEALCFDGGEGIYRRDGKPPVRLSQPYGDTPPALASAFFFRDSARYLRRVAVFCAAGRAVWLHGAVIALCVSGSPQALLPAAGAAALLFGAIAYLLRAPSFPPR